MNNTLQYQEKFRDFSNLLFYPGTKLDFRFENGKFNQLISLRKKSITQKQTSEFVNWSSASLQQLPITTKSINIIGKEKANTKVDSRIRELLQ